MSIISTTLIADEASLKGSAFYLERIALPGNAIFEATLEDVSLMDVPAIVMGRTIIDPAGNVPIDFKIQYKSEGIQSSHRYNVRGKITVDGRLIFITDTAYPVFDANKQEELKLRMKMVQLLLK